MPLAADNEVVGAVRLVVMEPGESDEVEVDVEEVVVGRLNLDAVTKLAGVVQRGKAVSRQRRLELSGKLEVGVVGSGSSGARTLASMLWINCRLA